MIKRSRKRRTRDAPEGSARAKGDIVEQIVAAMHKTSDVQVETNVFLCSKDDDEHPREIDVLLTSRITGYPVHMAIECKNQQEAVGVAEIDKFIGQLRDVGIPTQLGIFVSASRYTEGAVRRAEKAGIRTLLLEEVTDKLSQSVREAVQSIVYLLLTITRIEIRNDISEAPPTGEMLFFHDQRGSVCGSVPDLVWLKWRSGEIPAELGQHQVDVDVPEGWLQIVGGQVAQVSGILVGIQITGHMVTFPGSVSQHQLVQASDGEVDRWQVKAEFETPSGRYPVSTYLTEESLHEAMTRCRGFRLTIGRFRLPRIRWMAMYWPPSESTIQRLLELMRKQLEEGKQPDLASLDLVEIEGTDMRKVWEPIAEDHPLIQMFATGE
jgi:hypothetical protein